MMATLGGLMAKLDELSRDEVIYAAEPWTAGSEAVCRAEPEDGGDPSGLAYFLEVDLVHDVAEVWSKWRGGRRPTTDELTEAAIHYAQNDAYLPTDGSDGE